MVIGIENLPKNTLVSNSYEDSELYDEANHSSEMQYNGHARYEPPHDSAMMPRKYPQEQSKPKKPQAEFDYCNPYGYVMDPNNSSRVYRTKFY
jgi:hypothetical protein